ncbi:MAG: hypothetical protein ACYSR9_01860 [Planctomycetota bacterium]|jgi:hypothetical protein
MITTGYKLPFRFIHSDLATLSGQPVSIRIRTAVPDDAKLVYSTMQLFNQLASTGELGSEHLAPWDTQFSVTAQPSKDSCDLLFHVDPCLIADEAWVVLCHLLLKVHQNVAITRVEVLAAGDTSPVNMIETGESTYPRAYAHLPFVLDDQQPEGGSYNFLITLALPLTSENEATLNRWLDTWVQSILHGGYALAPIDPASDYVEPYGHGVDTYDTIIEWAVFKLRADPIAAIDALVNLLACFHVRCQPLQAVEIG